MFLLKAFTSENNFWKYILGTLIVIAASFIGQLPLLGTVMFKTISEGKQMPVVTSDFMNVLDKNVTFFLLLLSFAIGIIGVYLAVKFLHKQPIKNIVTSRKKIDWTRVFFAFAIWGVFQIIVVAVSYFTTPEDFVLNFNLIPFLILFIIAVIMIPIQTSFEELVFRGYLMQGFGLLAKNKWFPLLTTSVIFGLMHIANPEVEKMGYITMVYYIGTGLFLGIITLMDEGLELALGFHAANNLVGVLLVTSDWSAFQTYSVLKDVSDPTAGFEIVFPVVIVFPILAVVFGKKYGWSNWREKLTGRLEIHTSEKEA